jgi:hypothetical protein
MKAADLVNMFAVPFGFALHPDRGRLNGQLKQRLLAMESSGTAASPRPLAQRNAAVFESRPDLFRSDAAEIQELKAFCWEELLGLVGKLNGYSSQTLASMRIFNDCWFHVTRRSGFLGLHHHPNSSWSGIYCVDPGQSDPGSKDSGQLCFVNPMITCAMHYDAGNAGMQLPYAPHVANLALEAGQLILFPSWVLHDVKSFQGEGERITVAFNCWFAPADPG